MSIEKILSRLYHIDGPGGEEVEAMVLDCILLKNNDRNSGKVTVIRTVNASTTFSIELLYINHE